MIKGVLDDLVMAVFGCKGFTDSIFKHFHPKRDMLILEDGCGCGKLGINLALMGANVVLLDIDSAQLMKAMSLVDAINALLNVRLPVVYREADALNLPYPDGIFDLVFSEGVAEHWSDEKRQRYLDEAARVCKGKVIIIVPNAMNKKVMEMSEKIVITYKSMPPKEKPYLPGELRVSMERAGLKNVVVEPVFGNDFEASKVIVGVGEKNIGWERLDEIVDISKAVEARGDKEKWIWWQEHDFTHGGKYTDKKSLTERSRTVSIGMLGNEGLVLDAGCCGGWFSLEIAKKGNRVVGLDLPRVVRQAVLQNPGMLVAGDACNMPFKKEVFDAIYASELIEHLFEPESFVAESYRILKPDKKLIICTPWSEEASLCHPTHRAWFDKDSLTELLQKHDFEVKRIETISETRIIIVEARKK